VARVIHVQQRLLATLVALAEDLLDVRHVLLNVVVDRVFVKENLVEAHLSQELFHPPDVFGDLLQVSEDLLVGLLLNKFVVSGASNDPGNPLRGLKVKLIFFFFASRLAHNLCAFKASCSHRIQSKTD